MAAGRPHVDPSATASWAERRPQPGIDSACCSCSSYRASSWSITCDRSPMSAVSRSMRARIFASKAACSGERTPRLPGPLPAGLSCGGPAGQLSQRLRVARPGDQVLHDVPAGDAMQVSDHGR